jgi:hypothetical protein
MNTSIKNENDVTVHDFVPMEGRSDHFLFLEYQTLRDEIKEIKARIFKIMNFSFTVVPTATLVADKYQVGFLFGAIPFIVMAVSLLYLSENQGIMRCGRYIKEQIEPKIKGVFGWERWLSTEHPDDRRSVDRFLSYAFVSIFFVYYIAASLMAVAHFMAESTVFIYRFFAVLYFIVGLGYIRFFWQNVEFCTNRKVRQSFLRKWHLHK